MVDGHIKNNTRNTYKGKILTFWPLQKQSYVFKKVYIQGTRAWVFIWENFHSSCWVTGLACFSYEHIEILTKEIGVRWDLSKWASYQASQPGSYEEDLFYIAVNSTVELHYLTLGYLDLPIISFLGYDCLINYLLLVSWTPDIFNPPCPTVFCFPWEFETPG